ncbi:hypothetical protein DdX_06615 [Ditylenchus destructor]|uniref:Uncharacterized protein n=1 Tax=Ditylenchus destructor TaxID=166010 RepID=A0AAD4N5W1_9BILA|nr:hypothetical protein DdX_06615 [Ditylenchus destructor]
MERLRAVPRLLFGCINNKRILVDTKKCSIVPIFRYSVLIFVLYFGAINASDSLNDTILDSVDSFEIPNSSNYSTNVTAFDDLAKNPSITLNLITELANVTENIANEDILASNGDALFNEGSNSTNAVGKAEPMNSVDLNHATESFHSAIPENESDETEKLQSDVSTTPQLTLNSVIKTSVVPQAVEEIISSTIDFEEVSTPTPVLVEKNPVTKGANLLEIVNVEENSLFPTTNSKNGMGVASGERTTVNFDYEENSTTDVLSVNNATTPPVVVLNSPTARRFPDISIEAANMHELRQFKDELNDMLEKVEEAIHTRETLQVTTKSNTRRRAFNPISASLPNRLSALFLGRMNAALNFSPNLDGTEPKLKENQGLAKEARRSNEGYVRAESLNVMSSARNFHFNPTKNHSAEECKRLSQPELVNELKQKGTYNPDLMAWDVSGVFRFLDRSIIDQYERQAKSRKSSQQAFQRNVEALERLLEELNLQCNVTAPDVVEKISNLTLVEPRRSIVSPSIRLTDEELRRKRNIAEDLVHSFNSSRRRDDVFGFKKQKVIGDVHVVPFGCDKRGEEEDGYLRLCGACQAIRKLPDTFFPPFINEVMCDEDKACLYFYDYRMNLLLIPFIGFLISRFQHTANASKNT